MLSEMSTLQISTSLPVCIGSPGRLSGERRGLGVVRLAARSTICCKIKCSGEGRPFPEVGRRKGGVLTRVGGRKGRLVVFRASGFNGGGGGGGGWGDSNTNRILGNLALAVGLTYLSVTGQLGWILDAIVSVWLLVVLLPIIGLGALFWFVGRDIVQSSCPNCGNNFQIFKSLLKGGEQLCPYCSQPFSVQGDKFVRESDGPSDRFRETGPFFNGFSSPSKKERVPSTTIVDVEADVKDID